jgi:transglutaminase-like putative cysteine protease
MRFDVEHLTSYSYDEPVTLGPQTVRLRPRPDGGFRELGYSLLVDPAPVLRSELLDAAGNLVTRLWFEAPTRHLRIVSRFTAETLSARPARLILDPALRTLPATYPEAESRVLAPYREPGEPVPALAELVEGLVADAGGDPVELLLSLTAWLHGEIGREIREDGPPQTPAETLERGLGACRDQTVLFVAACRAAGLAARFVSGYQDRSAMQTERRHLHAWAEVYVPGCGWRGFDPTRGIAVGGGHVPIAAAAEPAGAMPIEGSYFGAGGSRLSYEVRIRTARG